MLLLQNLPKLYRFRVSEDFHYTNEIDAYSYKDNLIAYNQSMPWKASGDQFDLIMQFYRHQYQTSNIFQPLEGILVIINSPDELSTQIGHNLYIQDNTDFDITITVEISFIADDLKSWPVEDRNCFLEGEKKLEYFRIYTKSNCEQECLSMAIHKTCGCVPFYLIRAPSHSICGPNQKQCLKSVEILFEEKFEKDCDCLNLCNHMKYKLSIREIY